MVALCKEQEEDEEKQHQEHDLIDDCNQHRDKEVELTEHSAKVNDLDEAEYDTERKQDSHQISRLVIRQI